MRPLLGEEAIVESPGNAFLPLLVHYAETSGSGGSPVVSHSPARGSSEGKKCGTIKAFVRTGP